jgi:hypothetical protein
MRAIVSSDDIRLALTGKRYEPLAETMVFATKHVMIRALLNRGFDVIVDGTHSTEISIQRILEIDINATPLPIKTSRNTCVERAIKTNQHDLIPSIDRVYNNLNKLEFYGPECESHPISLELGFNEYIDLYGSYIFFEHLSRIRKNVIKRNLYGNLGEQS